MISDVRRAEQDSGVGPRHDVHGGIVTVAIALICLVVIWAGIGLGFWVFRKAAKANREIYEIRRREDARMRGTTDHFSESPVSESPKGSGEPFARTGSMSRPETHDEALVPSGVPAHETDAMSRRLRHSFDLVWVTAALVTAAASGICLAAGVIALGVGMLVGGALTVGVMLSFVRRHLPGMNKFKSETRGAFERQLGQAAPRSVYAIRAFLGTVPTVVAAAVLAAVGPNSVARFLTGILAAWTVANAAGFIGVWRVFRTGNSLSSSAP